MISTTVTIQINTHCLSSRVPQRIHIHHLINGLTHIYPLSLCLSFRVAYLSFRIVGVHFYNTYNELFSVCCLPQCISLLFTVAGT